MTQSLSADIVSFVSSEKKIQHFQDDRLPPFDLLPSFRFRMSSVDVDYVRARAYYGPFLLRPSGTRIDRRLLLVQSIEQGFIDAWCISSTVQLY